MYEFLDKYKWKLVETEDTALSAKHVHQHKSKHIAAIASKLAAELFQSDIIAPNIHTLKNNYTRFLVLQREDVEKLVKMPIKLREFSYRSFKRQPGKSADKNC